MTNPDPNNLPSYLQARAERHLGAQFIGIEFTLISVMFGIMLFMLIESATPILRDLQFEYWIYIVTDLAFLMWFWTIVIGHSLSFVGWPLDVGHALIFIFFTVVAGLNMHYLTNMVAWYISAAGMAYAGMLIILYDLRFIRMRLREMSGAAAELFQVALDRQRILFRVQILELALATTTAALVIWLPQIFIAEHWHITLALGVFANFTVLAIIGIRHAHSIRNLVLRKAAADIAAEEA